MRLGPLYYSMCSRPAGHATARGTLRALRCMGLLRKFCMPLDALALPHEAAAALMSLWRRTHWSSGDGMMPPEQLLAIYRLAATWPVRGDTVELGAWVGLTTSYLATAAALHGDEHVYAVDTFEGTREGGAVYPSIARFGGNTLEAFGAQIARAGSTDRVTPLIGRTTEVAKCYPGRAIRMLLVDADHSYEGVRADYSAWLPHMAPGGLMVFHDYLMADVARFVDEDLAADRRVQREPGLVVPNVFAVTCPAARTAPRAVVARTDSPATAAVEEVACG